MLGYPAPDAPPTRTLNPRLRLRSALLVLAAAGLYAAQAPTVAAAAPAPDAATVTSDAIASIVPAAFVRRAEGLSPKVLATALDAVAVARARGVSGRTDRLTVIDYTLPSTAPRLWVLDLAQGKVLFHELVAHGSGSGDKYATRFSNVAESRATSLGLFLTADTYEGGKGYSLKLKGLDPGVNDLAEARHIVMHGAWYVSDDHARQFGMIGRSWGCPAVPVQDAQPVIDAIKGGSFVFSYADSALPSVQRASLSPATSPAGSKAPRAVAASFSSSSRSHRSARTRAVARTRARAVAASLHGRSATRTAATRSVALKTAR